MDTVKGEYCLRTGDKVGQGEEHSHRSIAEEYYMVPKVGFMIKDGIVLNKHST